MKCLDSSAICCPDPGELLALLVFFVILSQFMTINSSFNYLDLNCVPTLRFKQKQAEYMTFVGLGGRSLCRISV